MKNKNSSQTLNLLRFEQVKSESFIFIARIDFLRPVSELFLTHRYHYRLWVSSGQCNKHLYRLFLPNLSKSQISPAMKGYMPLSRKSDLCNSSFLSSYRSCADFASNRNMGNISSLPVNITNERTTCTQSEKILKLAAGPTR